MMYFFSSSKIISLKANPIESNVKLIDVASNFNPLKNCMPMNFIYKTIDFFATHKLETLLAISALFNIYLLICWVKRERFLELKQMSFSLKGPRY